jgi:hypothetical protein
MREEDINALRAAVATLEHPGLAARLRDRGQTYRAIGRALPGSATKAVAVATTKAELVSNIGADLCQGRIFGAKVNPVRQRGLVPK